MGKRYVSLLLAVVLTLGLCACGGNRAADAVVEAVPTWQDQYDLGVRYLSEGNYEEAIIAFTAAIEIEPKNADAYLGAAKAYEAMGNTDAAIEILRRGLAQTEDTSLEEQLSDLEGPKPLEGYPKSERGTVSAGGYSIKDYNAYGNPVKLSFYTDNDELSSYAEYVYDERQTLTMIVSEQFAASGGTPGKSISYIDPQGRCYKNDRITQESVVTYGYSDGTDVQITFYDKDFAGDEIERTISYTMQDPDNVVLQTMAVGSLREHSIVVEEYQVTDTYYSGPRMLVQSTAFVFDETGTLLRTEPANG